MALQIISKIVNITKQERAKNALCGNYKYEAEIEYPTDPKKKIPNPETDLMFADRMVNEFIKNHIQDWEQKELDNTIEVQKEALKTDVNNLTL